MVALAREQQNRGHDVSVILPSLDGSIAAQLREAGIVAHATETDLLFGVHRPLAKLRALVRLVLLLRRLRPDVVHSHIVGSVITARVASWLADVPNHFAGNVHPNSMEAPVLRALEVGTAFCDEKTIASCSYTRDLYLQAGLSARRVALVPYAVDQSRHDPAKVDGRSVRDEFGWDATVPVVGKIAYFYPPVRTGLSVPPALRGQGVKGHEVLIRAMPAVLAEVPDAKFLIVGKGWGDDGARYEESLRGLVRNLGIEDAVRFTGERSDVPELLAAFDVSVHCSRSDNLGGTVESLLLERPMVVSDIPGFRDTVVHEETGLVVPRDDPGALAAAIVRLLRNRELARRLGRAGRTRMLRAFTLEHMVGGIDALLRQTTRRATEHYRIRRSLTRALAAPLRLAPTFIRALRAMR